jgi:hypothetical protein
MEAGREYHSLAEVAIDAVRPEPRGFTLSGQGADRAEYRLELRFELPLDPRTRAVLAELLTQSQVVVQRRGDRDARPPAGRPRRDRAHRP